MLLSFLLNIHSQYSAAMHRPSSWVYQALLMWAFCFGSWFRSECCQQVNYHLYARSLSSSFLSSNNQFSEEYLTNLMRGVANQVISNGKVRRQMKKKINILSIIFIIYKLTSGFNKLNINLSQF